MTRMLRQRAIAIATTLLALGALATAPLPEADLRAAAARGDAKVVASHIAARLPLDTKDERDQTALLLAVAGGHTAVAVALIDAGASVNAVAANQDTPWLLAGALGRAEILRRMLRAGPDLGLRNRYGGNALIPACERGHAEAAAVLLATKIDVDHINDLGWTCLLEIVVLGNGSAGHIEITRRVLEAGANPYLADRDGVSPLTHARRRGFTEIARLIAAKGGR